MFLQTLLERTVLLPFKPNQPPRPLERTLPDNSAKPQQAKDHCERNRHPPDRPRIRHHDQRQGQKRRHRQSEQQRRHPRRDPQHLGPLIPIRSPKRRNGLRAPQAQRAREESRQRQSEHEEKPGRRDQILDPAGRETVVLEGRDGALDDFGEGERGAEGADADDDSEEVFKVAGEAVAGMFGGWGGGRVGHWVEWVLGREGGGFDDLIRFGVKFYRSWH